MTRQGIVQISNKVLADWLRLPEGYTVEDVWQERDDKTKGHFRLLLHGPDLPEPAEGAIPPNLMLVYRRTEEDAENYELAEISDAQGLVYWPPWDSYCSDD